MSTVARLLQPIEVGTLSDQSASDACSASASCHLGSTSPFSSNSAYVPSTRFSSVIATSTKHPGISAVTLQSDSARSTNSASQHRDLQRAQLWAPTARPSRQLMPASMALISMSTGSLTKTTMTTRRSMDSPPHEPSVRRPSLRSWTLKVVILYHFLLLRCSTNRPTIIGSGSWRPAERCHG